MTFGRTASPCSRYPCAFLKPCPIHKPIPFAGAKSAQEYGPKWRGLSAAYLRRHPTCEGCGQEPSAVTDHITLRAKGGQDTWDNVQALCRSCHARKTGSEARAMRKSA